MRKSNTTALAHSAIIRGIDCAAESAENSGIVIGIGLGCSASMLDSRWAVSAAHCYFAEANTDSNGEYNYYANCSFEENYDFRYVAGQQYTGNGSTRGHWRGTLPLDLATDDTVSSKGLSVSSTNHIVGYDGRGTPAPGTCGSSPGGWRGCGANGCAVCVNHLTDYPRYFVRHPACAPDLLWRGK